MTSAGCLNRMFFWWINPLVDLASVQPLELYNLWAMPPRNLSGPLLERVDEAWKAGVAKRPDRPPSLIRTLIRVFRWRLVVTGIMQVIQQVMPGVCRFSINP